MAYYPDNQQLEVYWIDDNGAQNVRWKGNNGSWASPRTLGGPGFALPGARAVHRRPGELCHVRAATDWLTRWFEKPRRRANESCWIVVHVWDTKRV